MKTRKAIAIFSAAVMSLCALPMASVSAADAAVTGDVDGDGVLTGHDGAVVSRYLVKGDIKLTDEQLKTADVNGDGKVDTTDADWMYDNMTYGLGGSTGDYSTVDNVASINAIRASEALVIAAKEGAGTQIKVTDLLPTKEDIISKTYDEENQIFYTRVWFENGSLTQVQYNLLDMDGDGKITSADGAGIITMSAWIGIMDTKSSDETFLLNHVFHGNYFYGA